jgi:hypothetical protein
MPEEGVPRRPAPQREAEPAARPRPDVPLPQRPGPLDPGTEPTRPNWPEPQPTPVPAMPI